MKNKICFGKIYDVKCMDRLLDKCVGKMCMVYSLWQVYK